MSKQPHGHVSQTALSRHITNNDNYNIHSLIEGVVVGIHYPDEDSNRSKVAIEYDVDPTSVFGMGRLRNVQRSDMLTGIDDGEDNILRAADAEAAGGTYTADASPNKEPTPRYQTTGDRVLVGFVNGNAHRPIILGVLTHYSSRIHAKGQPLKDLAGKTIAGKAKKDRIRRTRYRGTELVLDEKGNVALTFGKTPDTNGKDTDDKKKLTINIGDFEIRIDNSSSPTTCEFKVKDGNTIFKVTKDKFEIGASSLEPLALGNKLGDLLKKIVDAYKTHTHTGNFGAPTPLTPDALAAGIDSDVMGMLSDWAKVSKAKP